MSSIDNLPVPLSLPARLTTTAVPLPLSPSFLITAHNRSYKHQYANIYFIRLRILREFVQHRAQTRWKAIAGNPVLVPRVLEVVKSQLCYIIGTVYMDMPLKPNVLEDIARDHSIPAPPPLSKFHSTQDNVMLEDESGRIRLVGDHVQSARLVTGVIIGALGMETPGGDFEVVDICYAGMPPQAGAADEEHMDLDETPANGASSSSSHPSDEWIAMISGLDVGGELYADAQIQMLIQYLTGEAGGPEDQLLSSQISRLIIAGNSLAPVLITDSTQPDSAEGKKPRRYGYDSTSFSPHPTITLSEYLADIATVMPIHILPGHSDPSGTILPQQPFPRAMFGSAATFSTFACETNPTYLRIVPGSDESPAPGSHPRTLLVNSGQTLDDMFKYLPSPPTTRLALAESTLRWRHMAPTAPDTLWCHPYFTADPFILRETPDVYVIGNQPRFQTRLVEGVDDGDGAKGKRRCRIVLVPRFAETGVLVLLNMRTLDAKTVRFTVAEMSAGGGLPESEA